jgi:hypothetical protein
MPIRPENKDRYPADWSQISQAVRDRAGNICEGCGCPNHAMIRRGVTQDGVPVWRLAHESSDEAGRSAIDGRYVPNSEPDLIVYKPPVKVILTVAHLDHQPENCDLANLKAWCQRCHNAYDAPMRRAGTKARARAQNAAGDLFQGASDAG